MEKGGLDPLNAKLAIRVESRITPQKKSREQQQIYEEESKDDSLTPATRVTYINLIVKIPSNETVNLVLEDRDINIQLLVNLISHRTGIPVTEFRLIYQGKDIQDLTNTSIYNVGSIGLIDGSFLEVRLRLKGGMNRAKEEINFCKQ